MNNYVYAKTLCHEQLRNEFHFSYVHKTVNSLGFSSCADPEGNHKNIGFLSDTGPDPLKNHKATIQCWAIIGTPAKRNLNGLLLAGQ